MGLLQDFNAAKKVNGDLQETEAIAAKLAKKYGGTVEEILDFVYCERYTDETDEAPTVEDDEDDE